ncbi:hypothetical protein FM038_010045 [Shewanella eurypsychrophilus]|uniref:Uncharacterized protein n=2 Tax=Shewanella TaxID=22 RepID=A0ABX6V5C6_9GAMM|nr:hypothetical protein [Shewanella eurypsychrophilus]QPG57751.2 hypothetical protein FM038_010045 [Shewanella eurypsychrophilus]
MNRLTKLMYALIIATSSLLLAIPASAQPDSFFDVFFDIELRDSSPSQSPLDLTAVVEMRHRGGETRTIQTEILSMDLSSSGSLPTDDGAVRETRHNAMVKYRLMNIGSSGQDGVRFAELVITCSPECRVTNSRSMTKKDHRGHVTVLK